MQKDDFKIPRECRKLVDQNSENNAGYK
jgi:hypothetical protein